VVGVVQVKLNLRRGAKTANLSIPRGKPAKGDHGTDLVDGRNDGPGTRKDLSPQFLLGEVRGVDTLDLSGFGQIPYLLPAEQDVAARTI
jgi:hypothetical protein